jgi:heat shock protein HslJ
MSVKCGMLMMRVWNRVLIPITVICLLAVASVALNNSSLPQLGKDLSEFQDTFWHLTRLRGSHADFSGVVIEIQREDIVFTTPLYFSLYAFEYKPTGLEFSSSPSAYSDVSRKNWAHREIARVFESALHKARSFDPNQNSLALVGEDRQPLIVLQSFRPQGIENRRWRIAKYRPEAGQQSDKDELIDARQTAEITFLNGGVYGSPTCGGWTGGYKVSRKQLTVVADVILAGVCPPEEWSENLAVLKAFKGELSIEEAEDQILLRDNDGRARVRLVPFGLSLSGPTK